MNNELLLAIIGAASSILTFFIGSGFEKRKQSLIIRSEMLNPIEDWLKGAEKIIGIFGDTIVTLSQGIPLPVTYNLEERRIASQFMIENTNKVFGILNSNSLQILKTKALSNQLSHLLKDIDNKIRYLILPMNSNLVELSNQRRLSQESISQSMKLKTEFDEQITKAYAIISKIRTRFI